MGCLAAALGGAGGGDVFEEKSVRHCGGEWWVGGGFWCLDLW